jgi:hypothetical protein
MPLRPFLEDRGSCASYLFGCTTHNRLAVVDLGALIAGLAADAASASAAIVPALTAARGLVVAATSWQPQPVLRPAPTS